MVLLTFDENVQKTESCKLLAGLVGGIVVAIIILGVLVYLILEQNMLQQYAKIQYGKLVIDWDKFNHDLSLPILIGSIGIGLIIANYVK